FFFQAEDGIRDGHVTGVQTCALPIYWRTVSNSSTLNHGTSALPSGRRSRQNGTSPSSSHSRHPSQQSPNARGCWRVSSESLTFRSEERRVGKECRSRWSEYQLREKAV